MTCRGLFVGLATLDLVQRVDRPPGVNEKIVARRADLAAGGPATTAAVTFHALGGHSVLLSTLGTGPIAGLAAEELDRAGISVVDAWAGGGDLSISAITVLERTGQRSVVSRNAADTAAAVPAELPALVRDCAVVLADGHHPVLAVAAARAARRAGVPLVLDCGSAKPVYADLVPLAEAAVCSAGFRIGERAGFDAVADGLLTAGTQVAAMTDGAGPVRWRTRQAEGVVEVPAVPVRDTLGAGDVLHGAVAFALAAGVPEPERYLRFGAEVAALRVQHPGPRGWLGATRLRELAAGLRR
ncbi:MAG TPA: PfkB family carbohydrate kinase [Pseudonocardiaceae bacterium]|nr:PfkB family carbohydrate kinase [Pseudonocardiaceae bacterium]